MILFGTKNTLSYTGCNARIMKLAKAQFLLLKRFQIRANSWRSLVKSHKLPAHTIGNKLVPSSETSQLLCSGLDKIVH